MFRIICLWVYSSYNLRYQGETIINIWIRTLAMRILKHPWEDDIFIAKRSSVQQLTIMVGMTACTTPVLPHPLLNGSKTPHFTACWHEVPIFLRVQSLFCNDNYTTEMYCSLSLVNLYFQYCKINEEYGWIEKNVHINWCSYTPRWKDSYRPGLGNEAEVSHTPDRKAVLIQFECDW